MKKLYFRLVIIACVILVLSTSSSKAVLIKSGGVGGNWSSTSTWVGGVVPGSGDGVIISSGTTVTVDSSATCLSLTIDGTLQFADPSAYVELDVNGDVNVASGGTLQAAASANNYGVNWISIYGNLEIDGTFTAKVTGSTTRMLAISMRGSSNHISGSAIDFSGYLEIDVGALDTLDLDSPVSISGRLYLTHGTLNNTSHNFTLESSGTIDRWNSDAVVTSAPAFSGASQTINYWATMTTGPELPDSFSDLRVDIAGGGAVTLGKSVTVSGLLLSTPGAVLITGSNAITISGYISQADVTSYVIGNLAWQFSSTGIRDFPVGSATAYRPVTVHVTGLTGGGTITVSETDAAPASSSLPSGVNKISSVRYWTLTKSAGITAVTADVTLSWGPDDGVGNPAEITVVHGDHSTGNWDAASGTGSGTASSGTVTGTGFTSFSDFTLGTTGSDNSLAVDATSFAAKADVESVTLTWKTQSEVDNAGFNILRQGPGETSFKLIASYTSNDNLKGMGISSSGRSYDFTDTKVKSGLTYQYKIQSVSTKGTTKDLTTLSVTVDIPKTYALYQNYPNPFNPSTTIRFDLKQTSTVTLEIYNVLGQRVEYWNYGTMDAGRYNENVNLDAFASGVYYYKLVASGLEPTAVGSNGQKFTATKKLLLVK
jgi:hypothetical protein